ncbi:MAG: hypothetical protein AAFP00_01765, partial [Bacteroidota bacterium]
GTISADFVKVTDKLKEAAYLIGKQEAFAYPIFLVARVPLSVGELLINKGEIDNQWYYYAAYLEALVQCGLMAADKKEAFKETYKDPEEFCCLLVVDTNFTNFVYMPYPVD